MVEHEENTLKLFFKPCNINPKTNNRILFNFPYPLSHNTKILSIMDPTSYLIFPEDNSHISSDPHYAHNPLLKFEGQPARIQQFLQDALQRDFNRDNRVHLQQKTAGCNLSDSRS